MYMLFLMDSFPAEEQKDSGVGNEPVLSVM